MSVRGGLSQRERRGLVVLLVLTLFGLGYWGYQQISWRTETIDRGYSEAAREDPYLAAQLFLEQQKRPVSTHKGFGLLGDLDEADSKVGGSDTLILVNSYRQLQGERFEQLWRWVEGGGQLIVAAHNPYIAERSAVRDPLFERLGIRLEGDEERSLKPTKQSGSRSSSGEGQCRSANGIPPIPLEGDTVLPSAQGTTEQTQELLHQALTAQNPDHCRVDEKITSLTLGDLREPLHLQLSSNKPLIIESTRSAHLAINEEGVQMAQFSVGAGQVSVLTQFSLWENTAFDCFDHAYLLWQFTPAQGHTWILSSQTRPSLLTLLWRYLPATIVLAFVVLMLWLWMQAHRFGPIVHTEASPRRALIEHLQASADLLWRRQRYRTLLAPSQAEIMRLMRIRTPGFGRFTPAEQWAEIGRLVGLAPQAVEHTMQVADRLQAAQLVAQVQQLQIIKDRLCRR